MLNHVTPADDDDRKQQDRDQGLRCKNIELFTANAS